MSDLGKPCSVFRDGAWRWETHAWTCDHMKEKLVAPELEDIGADTISIMRCPECTKAVQAVHANHSPSGDNEYLRLDGLDYGECFTCVEADVTGRIAVARPAPYRPHVYSVRLSKEEVRQLNRMALDSGRRVSDIIRDALEDYMERFA